MVVLDMASANKSSATPLSPFNLSTSGATLFSKFILVLSMSLEARSAFFKVWSKKAHEIPREKMVLIPSPTSLKQPLCLSALAWASSYSLVSSAILASTLAWAVATIPSIVAFNVTMSLLIVSSFTLISCVLVYEVSRVSRSDSRVNSQISNWSYVRVEILASPEISSYNSILPLVSIDLALTSLARK